MAELADALDSGSSGGNFVKVQVLLPAPKTRATLVVRVFLQLRRPLAKRGFLWYDFVYGSFNKTGGER